MRKGIMSLEAIHFQSSSFFADLTKAISECWSENGQGSAYKDVIKSASAKKILKVIKEHTNLTVEYSTRYIDAGPAIMPAMIRPDHVFYQDWYRTDAEFLDYFNDFAAKSRNKVLEASVDLKNSKVGGFFAEEKNELMLPTDFLAYGSFYGFSITASEAAAVVLHEIGHAFTFMEFLTRIHSGNQVLAYLNAKRLNLEPEQFKVVVANISSSFGMSKEQAAAIERAKNDEETAVLLMAINESKTRSELGINLYDATSCEQLADQFAARHGAGKELLSVLDKVGGLEVYENRHQYGWMVDILTGTAVIACGLLLGGAWAAVAGLYSAGMILSVVFADQPNLYDNAEHRPTRIKNDLIERLKDRELTNDERKGLIEIIEIIDKVIAAKKGFPNLSQHIALLLRSSYRKAYNFEILQKQLEAIASNHLFVQSAKLQTLV